MTIREEVAAYVRACEHVLSSDIVSTLTDDERALVQYYVAELSQKLEPSVARGGSALF